VLPIASLGNIDKVSEIISRQMAIVFSLPQDTVKLFQGKKAWCSQAKHLATSLLNFGRCMPHGAPPRICKAKVK